MALAEDDDRHVEDGRTRPPGRGWTGWLSAGTFVLGVVAGVLLLGLLSEDPPVAPSGQAAAPAPAGPPTEPATATGRIEVNAACLRAINAAQDITAAVEDLGTAAAALDAAQLDEVIRRIQPLQGRLQENSAACEVTGSRPDETALPTPPTPASPTD